MALRSVRLDPETERALEDIVHATGLTRSGALKQGLLVLRQQLAQHARRTPYEIYAALDLGPGGYAIAPSTQVRRGVQQAVQRKLRG